MRAIRKIISLQNNFISFKLPSSFHAKKVEVIILPVTEKDIKEPKKSPPLSSKFRGALSKHKLSDLDSQLDKIRDEWNRNIY